MLYQVTLRQTYYAQQCLNVFHYTSSGTPAGVSGSLGLLHALGFIPEGTPATYPENALFANLRNVQSSEVHYDEVQAEALYDDADFYTRPFADNAVGARIGLATTPTLAYGFFSSRVNRAIRRGFKRFVGVVEQGIGDGGVIVEPLLTDIGYLGSYLGSTATYDDAGNTLTYIPAVLSYEKYTTDSGKTAYRPYATLVAQLTHMAQGIQYSPYATVRTQTSRQYGRGA